LGVGPGPAPCIGRPVADAGWQATIAALLVLGTRTGVEPSAFGSLLWEHLTGLAYLSPQSDLDVLWQVPADFDVLALVFGIAQVQRDAPIRIDGEVIFPDGSAVNWRELWNAYRAANRAANRAAYRAANRSGHWAEDRATVLAKTMEGVRLLDIASLPGAGGRP
jgi:phosphoribosyl-dephospho-CoA transferase